MDENRGHNPADRRTLRVLLMMPEIGARRGGGILQVGCGLMRLLDARRRDGVADCRVLSLGRPDDGATADALGRAWGDRLRWFGKRRLAFCAAAIRSMLAWADLAIITHLGLGSILPLVPRRLRPPTITFIHGIEVWRRLSPRHKLSLRASDYVVANSRFTIFKARQFNAWLDGVRCCPLGIPLRPPADLPELDASLGFTPAPHDVLIVGRMAKGQCHKGHRELIEAMERVVGEVPDARLIVVGAGNDAETYRELARRSPAARSIHFAGFVPDESLRALYRRVGVFAMPSRQEGFGLVYAEAMEAGLPCVASTCDASGEVVLDGETGILVDPSDRVALAHSLVRLLKDDALRARMGRRGRERLHEHFTEQCFHERFWELIQEAISPR